MKKHIASVSFGKDSLAMLLKMIENGMPLDEVVYFDTGMEFKAIYDIKNQVKTMLCNLGIKYTELYPKRSFKENMLRKTVRHRDGRITHNGYSWCGGRCRWGTMEKVRTIEKYCKGAIQYVGIAYDEPKRIKNNPNKSYPLYDWQMTEKECLEYCYNKGYFWEESGVRLYDVLDRVSCWCCANKNLKELANYKKYLPKYWDRLKRLQDETTRPFKGKLTIYDIEKKIEEKQA